MLKKAKKGFTIVELVIVIAVIAILAAVLIPTFTNVVNNAKESAALSAAKNAYTEYIVETGEKANPDLIIKVEDDDTYYFLVENGSLKSKTITVNDTANTSAVTVAYAEESSDTTDTATSTDNSTVTYSNTTYKKWPFESDSEFGKDGAYSKVTIYEKQDATEGSSES